jgi:hypothetical protein
METTRLPQPTDIGRVSAHHTISVEPFCDHRRPDVHEAVVERDHGVIVQVCCCDVDVREGATLDQVAHAYAEQYEADYVQVTEVFR